MNRMFLKVISSAVIHSTVCTRCTNPIYFQVCLGIVEQGIIGKTFNPEKIKPNGKIKGGILEVGGLNSFIGRFVLF